MNYGNPFIIYPSKETSSLKTISFFLLIIGLIFITVGYVKNEKLNTPPIIEYRYVPQTFTEKQDDPTSVNDFFHGMFHNRDPWSEYHHYKNVSYNEEIPNEPTYRPIVETGKSIKQPKLI